MTTTTGHNWNWNGPYYKDGAFAPSGQPDRGEPMTRDPLANPTRTRTTADQLILDLSCMWLDRYDRACHLPLGGRPGDRNDEIWRATAIGIVDGWTTLYLLGQLRTHAPAVAEHAAELLNYGTPNLDAERMPELVREWAAAIAEGRSLLGRLP